MPIYLRNGIWQIDIVHNGKRVRRSAQTTSKTEAQELHDKVKHELWRVERMGDRPKRFWDEACIRWIQEKSHKKSLRDDKAKILALTQFRGKLLTDLSRDYVMSVVGALSCADATKNRYISLIRSILHKCSGDWEWLDKSPSLTCFKESKKRVRWITQAEAKKLIDVLPEYLADLAQFSLMTGLRQGNVLALEWSQIDLNRRVAWIHADQAKGDAAIGIPLNESAMKILMAQTGKHPDFVFTRKGMPVSGVSSKGWAKALSKAGIADFRWHDLRHTWASWMIQSGVPLYDLKEMGGWKSIEMVQRYAHLAPQHLHKHAKLIDETNVTYLSHTKNTLAVNLDEYVA